MSGIVGWRGKWRVIYDNGEQSQPMSLDSALGYMRIFKAKSVTDGRLTFDEANQPGRLRLFWERIVW